MSRSQQDQFIDDDEEETCPLCVEEFDLTDQGFRPCPCGYQICQFCYNNVKNNMNGLCPACRRPYNEADVEYKTVSAEDQAAHKIRLAQKQKKTQAALQKEKQKTEADNLTRKHLAGMRVVQKNLVYVTGLQPTTHQDQLLQTLRGHEYFGQYGKIIKIVVSKAKDPSHPNSVGVYVTFERREDAAACIAAVDGTKNHDRTLRAQFGTTKYCSAYLRGENCTNRNCMFLHEPGEANESYSRADLSALNAGHGRAPPPQSQQPVASASQPMARQSSQDQPSSPSTDRPALPSTASWASKAPQQQPSRTESRSTSTTLESPAPQVAVPAQPEEQPVEEPPASQESFASEATVKPVPVQRPRRPRPVSPLIALIKDFKADDLKLFFSLGLIPQSDIDIINTYPSLFDQNGGAKRKLRREREEEQRRMEQEAQAFQQPPSVDQEEDPELGGSLALGGEPEEPRSLSQPQSAIQPPGNEGLLDQRFQFGGIPSPGIGERGMTPSQHQQLLLGLKPNGQGSFQSNAFQQQSHPPGHQRNTSRFSFANDATPSTNIKPVANAKIMNQQSSVMPNNHFGAQHQPSQFYTSNVQGPPPGLKASGTPPVSGGMTFGQGHGFATGGLQYGAANANTSRNANEEMMRNLLRRDGDGLAKQQHYATPSQTDFPPLSTPSRQHSISLETDFARKSTPPVPPGFEGHATAGASESRRSTPTVPPGLAGSTALQGLGKPLVAIPDLDGLGVVGSRPSSRASLKRVSSHVVPAIPLRIGTPVATPTPTPLKDDASRDEVATPTKAPKGKAKAETVPGPAVENAVKEVQAKTEPSAGMSDATRAKGKAAVVPPSSAPQSIQPAAKGQATVQASDTKAAPVTPSKADVVKKDGAASKKPQLGKLDLTSAVKEQATAAPPTDAATPTKALPNVSQTPPATSKPESPSVLSPAVKQAPKTLRVLPTAKQEVAPPTEPVPSQVKLPSRQPSVASIQIPGTPSSEQVSISDNVSMPSTSQSRANSPPPSKVGSAPVRAKTKNQLKKERQERAKAIEEEKKVDQEEVKAVEEEPAQEAIISRKKKTRKEKEKELKPKSKEKEKEKEKEKDKAVAPAEPAPAASVPPSPRPKATVSSPVKASPSKSSKPSTPVTPAPIQRRTPPPPSPHEPSPPPTPTITAAQLIAEIKATVPGIQKCIDSLFRSPASAHYKPGQPITQKDLANPSRWRPETQPKFSKEEVDALLRGEALRYGGEDLSGKGEAPRLWDRGLVTPTGAHLRALSEELELRFLELEKAIKDLPEDLKFHASKPQNDMKFPSVDLEALKRGFEIDEGAAGTVTGTAGYAATGAGLPGTGGRGTSVMERMVQDGSALKKGAFLVDEASNYINQHVMPLPTPAASPEAGIAGIAGVTGAGAGVPSQGSVGVGGSAGLGSEIPVPPSVEIAERQLGEARRVADERDAALKKVVKKNRKLLGMG